MTEGKTIPLVDLVAQHQGIAEEVENSVIEVLRSGQYIGGPLVEAFEGEFARYCDSRYAVTVNSGTAALHVALLALEIGPGDEVITVSHTFVATVEAIVQAGATPVFVDIDPVSYSMDVSQIEAAITPRTKAIIPVHLYGQPADMDPILEIAKERGLAVIEDSCQAHGATYKGRRAGSMSDIACFSFYPSKNLGAAGAGGAATTDSEVLAQRIEMLRDHGQSVRYYHDIFGLNYRMTVIQAAILRAKLPHLDAWNESRRQHAAAYNELLAETGLGLPVADPDMTHVYHLYVVRSRARDELARRLGERGIGTGIHYPIPAHLQPPYKRYGGGPESLPHTEEAAASILSLPMYAELTPQQVERVADAVRGFARSEIAA
ncbi:MAG: DegT/DnrJ/EryC1/StrS family aminotransferase [Dehalococcoidia bacterium]